MHVFFSVGEPSGDQHAAHLITELRRRDPSLRISGFGGPRMSAAGFEKLFNLTDLAVMGFFAVVPLLWKFLKLYWQAKAFLKAERPDMVVLVDFPGFNWHIAKAAKRLGIRVVYYCPPQIWAWGPWRILYMRWVDHVLSVLPFEAEWYRKKRVSVEYVGHPFFDEVAEHPLDEAFCQHLKSRAPVTIGLLPGSRSKELSGNFNAMLETARRLCERHSNIRFHVACYKPAHQEFCLKRLAEFSTPLPIDVHVGRTSEIIASVDCCLMVSGSVSLEVLSRALPAAALYRIGSWTKLCKPYFITVPYFSLPNLMANRPVMPEFLMGDDPEPEIAGMTRLLDVWLSVPGVLGGVRAELEDLRSKNAQRGGLVNATEALIRQLEIARPQSRETIRRVA